MKYTIYLSILLLITTSVMGQSRPTFANSQIKNKDTINRFFYCSAVVEMEDREVFHSFYFLSRDLFPTLDQLESFAIKDNDGAQDVVILSIYEFKNRKDYESFRKRKPK